MKLLKKLKPKRVKLEEGNLNPEKIIYFCSTKVIDEIVCKRRRVDFDKSLADEMDKHIRMYFVVLQDMTYDIVSGIWFEPYKKRSGLVETPLSDKAEKCIDHYINVTHYGR